MDYTLNPSAFMSGIFPVPDLLVDENIRLASVVQLKVILYILRNSRQEISKEKISEALSIDPYDVSDAMVFWAERGLLMKQGDVPALPSVAAQTASAEAVTNVRIEKQNEAPVKAPKKVVADIPSSRPSHEQVAARCKESEELVHLFREVQLALGKTVGYEGQATLLMMHDTYGLPIEVILMAVEYAVSKNKTGFAYIGRIGKTWSENEIDTIEAAEQYILEHDEINEVWNKLRSLTEINNINPTEKQHRYLVCWVKEYGYDVNIIYQAYEESVNNTGKFNMPYMDKIIRTWHEFGVKTVVDINRCREEWEKSRDKRLGKNKKSAPRKNDVKGEASYDLDLFTKSALDL